MVSRPLLIPSSLFVRAMVAVLLSSRISSTIVFISCDERLEFSAMLLISSATRAKPFPISPALVASMEALSESRSVFCAISSIMLMTFLIFSTLLANLNMGWVCSDICFRTSSRCFTVWLALFSPISAWRRASLALETVSDDCFTISSI